MATLIVSDSSTRFEQAASVTLRLQEWLQGHWAIVFSHPEDFAPHPTTPRGFLSHVFNELLQRGVKAIALGTDVFAEQRSWLDDASDDDAVVVLASDKDAAVVDITEHALGTKLANMHSRFAMVLDEHGRCRSTMNYRARNPQHARTLEDMIEVIGVLRSDRQRSSPSNSNWNLNRQLGFAAGPQPALG
jgi:alkyl hydroperoxide reductase subunit AhpC